MGGGATAVDGTGGGLFEGGGTLPPPPCKLPSEPCTRSDPAAAFELDRATEPCAWALLSRLRNPSTPLLSLERALLALLVRERWLLSRWRKDEDQLPAAPLDALLPWR